MTEKRYKMKIIKVFKPSDVLNKLTKKELLQVIKNEIVDYHLAAKLYCKKLGGRLPTMADLGKIASGIYKGNPSIGAKDDKDGLTYIPGTASSLGLPEPAFFLWSGEEDSGYGAYGRYFDTTYSDWGYSSRGYSGGQAMCLGDYGDNKDEL